MQFEIVSHITGVGTFATASGIREIARLRKRYGRGRWRKRKGIARVRLPNGATCTAELHGMKPPGSAAGSSKSNTCLRNRMAKPRPKEFVVCISNAGYEVSLEPRKIYVAVDDPEAEKLRMVRVVDESGDDYLYPRKMFRAIELPQALRRALLAAA